MRCWFVPLLQAVAWAVARLPQPLLVFCGRALARLMWWPLAPRRRIARINVGLCFPALDARARNRLADTALVNSVVGTLELVRAWHAPSAALRGMARIDGLEHLQAALARGQGVLLMCGHFTTTELAVRLLSEALGRPIRVVVRRHNNACLEAWQDASRTRVFGPTIGKKDVRPLLKNLLDGQAVTYSADQNFNYNHAFVPFFGIPAATLTATPDIVERGKAVLLPFWYRRAADGRYDIRVEAPWPGWPAGDPAADAARYMAELEKVVRECPEQYLWTHQRFKTRPPGEPPIY